MLSIHEEQNSEPKPIINLNNLAKNHHKRLLYFVLHKVRNEEDAKDIVQSTFIEAMKSLHNFKYQSKPETWLTGIAINLIKNHFYQQKNKPTFYLEEEANNLDNTTDYKTPATILEDKQLIMNIQKVFSNMPSDMRVTAEKVLLHNLSYEDATVIKNKDNEEIIERIPIGTVRSRVARAREMLRKLQETTSILP